MRIVVQYGEYKLTDRERDPNYRGPLGEDEWAELGAEVEGLLIGALREIDAELKLLAQIGSGPSYLERLNKRRAKISRELAKLQAARERLDRGEGPDL